MPRRSLVKPIFLIVLALVLGWILSIALRSCGAVFASDKDLYDWSSLNTSAPYYTYSEDGEVVSSVGVDVSEHQEHIDWNAVANSGVDFAFVRVGNRGTTEGELYEDAYFRRNVQEAQQAGLTVGAYFFSQAVDEDEAREEADFVRNALSGLVLTGPVVFDFEQTPGSRVAEMSAEQVSACARAFCDGVSDLGSGPMLYGNAQDLQLLDKKLLDAYPVWFAEYGVAHPTTRTPFAIWQYSADVQVPGISTPADMNIWMVRP